MLKSSHLEQVLQNISRAAAGGTKACIGEAADLISYYKSNRDRMAYEHYKPYRVWADRVGAIESGHRTVVQQRMKRSGQRWSKPGAQHMLHLRVVRKNKQWSKVVELAATVSIPAAA